MDKIEELLKESKYFEFRPGTVQAIRKTFNLDAPGRMDEAIDIIQEWIQKQNHFMRKDFERRYLERMIINNKGLLERVKSRLDKKCTVVNLSKLYKPHNLKEFKHMAAMSHVVMPKSTEDFKRIVIRRVNPGHKITSQTWLELNKISALTVEYILRHDYCLGYHVIVDLRNVDITALISSVDIGDMRDYSNSVIKTSGIRMKSIHVLSSSKLAFTFISLLEQFFSTFKYEVYVHKDLKDLHKYIPKELLPSDYGGEADTLENISARFMEELSSEELTEHMKWVCEARTDESKRPAGQFNEQYMGLPGTFRTLIVD